MSARSIPLLARRFRIHPGGDDVRDTKEYDERQVPMPWAPPPPPSPGCTEGQQHEAAGVEAHWRVTDALSCDWALRRMAEADRELAEVDAQVAAEVARLRARIEEAEARGEELKRPALRTRRFFEAHVRAWAESERSSICTGRRKSRGFLHGRIGWQKGRDSVRVVDEAALLAHCQQHRPEWVSPMVDEAAVRRAALTTGEEFPGTEVHVGEDTFYVETTGGES